MKSISLNDIEKKESILITFDDAIPSSNFYILNFQGKADGNLLTRNYDVGVLKNKFVKIISMHIDYFSDNTIWEREIAYDNNTFTTNSNTRYSILRNFSKLDMNFLADNQAGAGLGVYRFLFNNINLPIFPVANLPAIENIELNILPAWPVTSGIDFSANLECYNTNSGGTKLNPYMQIIMPVELYSKMPKLGQGGTFNV